MKGVTVSESEIVFKNGNISSHQNCNVAKNIWDTFKQVNIWESKWDNISKYCTFSTYIYKYLVWRNCTGNYKKKEKKIKDWNPVTKDFITSSGDKFITFISL